MFVLQFLLLAAIVARKTGEDCSGAYWSRLERTLEFLGALSEGGGPMSGRGWVGMPKPRAGCWATRAERSSKQWRRHRPPKRYRIAVAGGAVVLEVDVQLAVEILRASEEPIGGWVSRGYHRKVPSTTPRERERV